MSLDIKKARILFVDDEQNILNSMKRNLREYNVTTCNSPYDAIKMVKASVRSTPFAVIVSDYKMPKVTGLELLIAVKDVSPNTVRVMLTGYTEHDTAIKAINEGAIFRFLTKPTTAPDLKKVLNTCIEQYNLVIAEKELLKGTLSGSIRVLTEVLSHSNPEAFGIGERVKRVVRDLLDDVDFPNKWQIEIAAMLSRIGLTAIPAEIITKVKNRETLTSVEKELYDQYPEIGANLISHIPRLDQVSLCVKYQQDALNSAAPFGAKVLNLAIRFDELYFQGIEPLIILKQLSEESSLYGPTLIKQLEKLVLNITTDFNTVALHVNELQEGMIVDQDVFTSDNLLLISKSQEITKTALMRLYNYKRSCGIKEPIMVIKQSESSTVVEESKEEN